MGTSLALSWLQSANDDFEVIKKIIDDDLKQGGVVNEQYR